MKNWLVELVCVAFVAACLLAVTCSFGYATPSLPPAPVAIPRDARQVRPGDAPAPTATAPAVFRHVGDTQASLRTTTTPIVVRNTPGGDCPGGICRVPQRGEPTPADASTKPSETPATAKGPVKSVLARTWNAKPVQAVGGRVRGVLGRLRCRGCR
jgi:hypothetical protein